MLRSLLVTALLSGCVFSPMSPADLAAEGAFATVTILDWGQTVGIAQRCDEGNPIIGRCGDGVQPGLYFPATIALHALVAWMLPADWRPYYQGLTIGIEGKTVYRNHSMGDAVTF